jgi:hypothetical protein
MDCHEVKRWLATQRDTTCLPASTEREKVGQHLQRCPACRAFEQRLSRLQAGQSSPTPHEYSSISTERIMRAVEQTRQTTKQLEDMRARQRMRMEQHSSIVIPIVGISFFTLLAVAILLPLVLLAQPDWMANMPQWPSELVYLLMTLVQYLQVASTLATKDTALLVVFSLLLVILMGMWLRLMRPPQQV